ncbi:protein-tyrosine phosphatase-like protein [Catenaria anguillulae PL171]|uniref:Protein-tyrosine phosphatase-like protein n=1 Tax=Catenaria anguillulae PL171 TaxID=765915 RepID=A0A1Y2I2D1_9FUNG|nr:protein-tyrosine phosphatase-like protein [Catenaria anguillulae PL171]
MNQQPNARHVPAAVQQRQLRLENTRAQEQLDFVADLLRQPLDTRAHYMSSTYKNILDELDTASDQQINVPGAPLAAVESQRPENKPLNRYSNVYPFDKNRVVVGDNGYINASAIAVPLSSQATRDPAYIAAQGPLAHTVADFWRMIHQHSTDLIICLTKDQENGRRKYNPYFAPSQHFPFLSTTPKTRNSPSTLPTAMLGAFRKHVEVGERYRNHPGAPLAVTQIANVVLRKFEVKVVQGPGQDVVENSKRDVWQIDCLGWPDHGALAVDELLAVVELARFVSPSVRRPWVVHCSAGCGRTGTLIAVDFITRYLESGIRAPYFGDHNDLVAATVTDLRSQRVLMVQTLVQFELVYAAVARYMELMGYIA